MVDICKCTGEGCPRKENCYRYTAQSYEYLQSYFTTPPLKEDGTCDRFWEIDEKDNRLNPTDKENNGH